jgi:hypothetical protein
MEFTVKSQSHVVWLLHAFIDSLFDAPSGDGAQQLSIVHRGEIIVVIVLFLENNLYL